MFQNANLKIFHVACRESMQKIYQQNQCRCWNHYPRYAWISGKHVHDHSHICQAYICSKLRTSPCSEVTHASTTFKLKKRQSNIEFDVFALCFIFFIPLSLTINVLNRNFMWYFLHASKWWCMCWHVHMRLHTLNEEEGHCVTKGKKILNLF